MAKAPKYLNYAYPDFSVQYFITTFGENETITIEGIIPKYKINFFSFTLYEKNGLPYYSKNDYTINIVKETDEFIHYKETFTTLEYSALIIRFYVKKQYENDNFYNYLPTLSENKNFQKLETIEQNSINVGNILQERIKEQNNIKEESLQNHYFFKPARDKLNNLFPNANAEYLIAFPKTFLLLITIKTEVFTREDYRFIGFMTSNYETTATDNSISLEEGNTIYRIWVCFKKDIKLLQNVPFHPLTDKVLCWDDNNKHPILVYREVRIQEKGLQLLDDETEPSELREIINYPEIEYF